MASRRAAWLVIALLSLATMGFGPPVLTDGDVATKGLTQHQLRLLWRAPEPDIAAPSAILVNPTTGRILFARNERQRRAPASLTKIVTALVALQRGRLDSEFVITGQDMTVYSMVGLQEEEEFTLNGLLHILLIPSDNVAALAIARGLAGDVDTFVGWMNELVLGWGLQDTHFANPHGLDDSENYSTALEMALIARQAMMDRTFAEIVGHAEADVGLRRVTSTNRLLETYPGTIGVKTGTTDRAGESLIALVERPSGKVLSVVLGSTDRFADTVPLLDYFYTNFAELHVDLPDTPQNRYLDDESNWHEVGLEEAEVFLISPWQAGTATYYRRIDDLSAHPDPGSPVGALEITLAGRLLAEVPLYAR